MALIVKLLHPGAVIPEMGMLRSCEDVVVGPHPRPIRTGVSIFVPHGMFATCDGRSVVSDEEIFVTMSAWRDVRKGDRIADLVFGFKTTVDEGDAAQLGPLA